MKWMVSNSERLISYLLGLDVGLTAASSTNINKNNSNTKPITEESVPYVIGDDDDSDSDDLVDIGEDDYPDDDLEVEKDEKKEKSKTI